MVVAVPMLIWRSNRPEGPKIKFERYSDDIYWMETHSSVSDETIDQNKENNGQQQPQEEQQEEEDHDANYGFTNDGINDDDGLGFAIEPIIPTIPTSYYDDTSGVEDFIGDLVGVDDDALPSLVVSAFEDDNNLDSNNNE